MDKLVHSNEDESDYENDLFHSEQENNEDVEQEYDDDDEDAEPDDEDDEHDTDIMGIEQQQITEIPQDDRLREIPSKRKRVRGLTRCIKLHKDFEEPGAVKRLIEFDKKGRCIGKYKAEISSYLGDLARKEVGLTVLRWKDVSKDTKDLMWMQVTQFYEIDVGMKKRMMHYFADALRNFRSKLYTRYILPNIGKPSKLKVKPKQYGLMDQTDWDKFVQYTHSDEFKALSESAKTSRAKHKYPHRLGRSGYAGLIEKLVKNQEIPDDEDPVRSSMWCKARQTKDGDYANDDLKDKANEIGTYEKEINEGSLKVDHGTDALTLAFGKDHSGRVRGVGKGVTPTRYWNIPKRRGSSKDCTLQRQLDEEKRENAEKVGCLQKMVQDQAHVIKEQGQKLKDQNHVIEEQGVVMKAILAKLSSKGMGLPDLETSLNMSLEGQNSLTSGLPTSYETPATSNHVDRSTHDHTIAKSSKRPRQSLEIDIPVCGSRKDAPIFKTTPSQVLTSEDLPNTKCELAYPKCKLAYPNIRNVVAYGTIFHSSSQQTVHGVPLQDDCYKVSIDKKVKPASFLPIQSGELKTVEEAYKSFVAWPKDLVIPCSKVPQTTSNEHKDNQNKKTKKTFTTINQLKTTKHTRSSFNKKNILLDDA